MTASRAEWLPDQNLNNKRFSLWRIDTIKQILQSHNRHVAWIEESGRQIFDIAERVLVERWVYQISTE